MTPSTVTDRNASAIGADSSDYDDIDDIVAYTDSLDISNLAAALGYKHDYNITGDVRYVNDSPDLGYAYSDATIDYTYPENNVSTTTNIKRVEIRVDASDTPENPDVILRAYSCNIGETDYYKRTY